MKKIRVTAVSYLNTKPLLYGLLQSDVAQQIDLQLNIPSVCAQKLLSGEADLGLVPVAVIPEIAEAQIISDYCIGTERSVKTVGIFANQPIEKLTALYLDHHSRTSVALTKILLEQHWQLFPKLLPAMDGYIDHIEGTTGGLVIGDRTIGLEKRFRYFYDLGEAWYDFQQLPFVFAAWVSNKELAPDFLQAFNLALGKGLEAIPTLMYLLNTPQLNFDLEEYFTQNISFNLDAPKRKSLDLFLGMLSDLPAMDRSLIQIV